MKTEDISKQIDNFHAVLDGIVRFNDVDSFGVVHNIQYLYWMEWARTDYFGKIGVGLSPSTFTRDYPFMVVHSEIDYFSPLHFNEKWKILTRIAKIGQSSVQFENIILTEGNRPVCLGNATLVHTDIKTGQAIPVPDTIRKMIDKFERSC